MVLLHSKSEDDTCYVKTSNLDGETNLKEKCVPDKFPHFKSEDELVDLRGVISYEKPNSRLYEFKGKLLMNNQEL